MISVTRASANSGDDRSMLSKALRSSSMASVARLCDSLRTLSSAKSGWMTTERPFDDEAAGTGTELSCVSGCVDCETGSLLGSLFGCLASGGTAAANGGCVCSTFCAGFGT